MANDTIFTHSLPNDVRAEQAVLGAIICRPRESIDSIGGMLESNDFYFENHQKIFNLLKTMASDSETIDVVTLVNRVKEEGITLDLDPVKYLMDLANNCPAPSNVVDYARIVRDKSLLRKLINASESVSSSAMSEECKAEELVDQAEQMFYDIGQKKVKGEFKRLRDLLSPVYESLANKDKNTEDHIRTGYSDIDSKIIDMNPGDFVLVGARPAMGKTAYAINVALNVAAKDKTVAIFSLEMSAEQIVTRMLSCAGMVDSSTLRKGNLENSDWQKLADTITKLSKYDILIDDTSSINTLEMKSKLRRLRKLDFIVIDYLGLLSSVKKTDNRVQEVSEITRNLKIMAKELGCPILCCAQLSRNNEQRGVKDRRPQLSDLRDSGSIEQDADMVMFLYREGYYDNNGNFLDTADKNIAEIIVAKNRHGATGTAKLMWMPQYTKFVTLDREEEHNG